LNIKKYRFKLKKDEKLLATVTNNRQQGMGNQKIRIMEHGFVILNNNSLTLKLMSLDAEKLF